MHEDFTRKEAVQGSSDRSFGFVMAAFFGLVALFQLLYGPLSSIRWWALVVAAAFLALRCCGPHRFARSIARGSSWACCCPGSSALL